MYEDLVKRLRELQTITEHCDEQSCDECENRELCDKHDNKTLSGTYKEAADAIEELARRNEQFMYTPPPAWIPVTERLPDIGEEVLCNCRARILFVLAWDGTHWHEGTDRYYMGSFVTHWMSLPDKPKGES